MTIAYLNGQFLPLEETHVSAMDRGFLFGDGVYEVIPVYGGQPFRLAQHLQRLFNSLAAIQLTIGLDSNAFEKIFIELIKRNGDGNQSIYLQCTRGPVPTREHAFPQQVNPTIFAFSVPLQTPSITALSRGITAVTVPDIRWQRCDIKAITLLPNVLLRQKAIEDGAQEAILINNGFAIEGSATNLFIVKSNVIMTPPLNSHILGGITRDLVLELASQHHYSHQETSISVTALRKADEIWLTSSNREIMPVIKLDGEPVGSGQTGPLWFKMIQHYQTFKTQVTQRL